MARGDKMPAWAKDKRRRLETIRAAKSRSKRRPGPGPRRAFLLFTLLWMGWYAAAQLSVLNVLTFAEALRTEFRWDFFLLEPRQPRP